MSETGHAEKRMHTTGRVLHRAVGYDILAWLFMLGTGERALREKLADLAQLQPGELVLDAGCGTGTLAITAKRRVGPSGAVHGVDPSAEMIARATKKARKADLDVAFQTGVAEALPYPNETFDVVLSTLMLHHLPRAPRRAFAQEIGRVLKPGGRVLVVDFGAGAPEQRRSLIGRIHLHGHVPLQEILGELTNAGLHVRESGAVGMRDLNFALAGKMSLGASSNNATDRAT
jgi:ubiquinone/menaquinone biosynthesis C-methylase UbiE